jgi:hypothetical protein
MKPRQNKCIGDYDNSIGPLLDQGRKRIVAIALAADLMNIGPYIVPLAMLAIAFMLIAAALWL